MRTGSKWVAKKIAGASAAMAATGCWMSAK
jgi:hypothetical protein